MLIINYMKIYLGIFLFLFHINLVGQDKEFASRIISDLTSKTYKGRGYTHNGINKSQQYIVNTLKSVGVKQIIQQPLKMPVSVIKKANVKFDNIEAELGKNIIIYPNSCSINGNYQIYKLTKNNLPSILSNDYADKFVLFDTSISNNNDYSKEIRLLTQNNNIKARGFIVCKSKKIMQVQAHETKSWVIMEMDTTFINAKNITINLRTKHIEQYKTANIIALIKGETDSIIAFSAHYDHLGELGNIYFPGANDNASGVSMTIDIAREFALQKNKYTIALMFFTGEEVGLVGSEYFVNHPLFNLNSIKYLFNLDVIGSGEKGITVVNGEEYKELMQQLQKINIDNHLQLDIQARGTSNNSDHAPFYKKGTKAVFIYAKGKTGPYHHPEDNLANLSMEKYESIVKLLILYTKQ